MQKQTTLPNKAIIQDRHGERYEVEALLGQGGFSAVYRVRDRLTRQKIYALKEIIDPKPQERRNLAFEAELLMRLDHRSLPCVYQVFENVKLNRLFMLMDYVEGKNLEALRKEQPDERFSLTQALALMAPIIEAVNYLHEQKQPVVHRDIKPANIIVSDKVTDASLVDFGLAKEYVENKTTGVFRYGTPGYAAPEQYGQGTNLRTDIYALSATIYTLLTGVIPTDALTRSLSESNADPLERADKLYSTIPSAVALVIEHGMSLRKEQRFPSVEEFWQELCIAAAHQGITGHQPIVVSIPSTPVPTYTHAIRKGAPCRPFSIGKAIMRAMSLRAIVHKAGIAQLPSSDGPPPIPFPESHVSEDSLKDFFISYAGHNKDSFLWSEWIKWQLDKAGYSTILLPQGIRLESNIDMELQSAMRKAKRVIAVLSPTYLQILSSQQPWIDIFKEDSIKEKPKLLSICGQECGQEFRALLESINYIDLVNIDETRSSAILLAAVSGESIQLTIPPYFPGTQIEKSLFSDKLSTSTNIEDRVSSDLLNSLPRVTSNSYISVQERSTEEIKARTEFISPTLKEGLEVFFSYSHQDREMRDELEKYLSNLKRQRSITGWYDGEIGAGDEWAQEIDRHLKHAHIILLLVSQDFLASNYCYETEMLHALERHNNGEACVIPIILRPSHWEVTPFSKLQVLPKGAKPIATWQNRDEAFLCVAKEIQKVVSKLSKRNYAIHPLNIDV